MNWLDWGVLAAYAVAVIVLGVWAGRRERDTTDFFLAGRSMTWFPVAVSSLATALSALTFIGVPGAAFGGNFVYLQLQLGNLIGWLLLAWLFLPAFYRLRVTTVYELLGDRFGPVSRTAGTVFFIISRILASGVRLAGCAIAVSVFFGIGLKTSIACIAFFALLYTATGGIKAVIWTDMLQFGLFMAGALVAIGLVWTALPEGFAQFVDIGRAHGKFDTFNFSWDLSDPTTFWAGNFFALVIGLAVGATDQDIAQRLLTCKDVRHAQRAAVAAGIAPAFTTVVFLTLGASLFAYYQAFPDPAVGKLVAEGQSDWMFPHFIVTVLPAGLRGLLVAGLLAAAMSSLDSALNGLASAAYSDIYRPFFLKHDDGGRGVRISRAMVIVFAVVLAAVAMVFGRQPSILWFGLRIMGYTYGALLGVFLLAVLTRRRGSETGNVVAMTTSVLVILFLTADLAGGGLAHARAALLAPLGVAKIAWPWAIVIGTLWTFGLAALWPPRRHLVHSGA
ncbi:MAG: sodium/solute symporter [Elusimicrobiota bacterium]